MRAGACLERARHEPYAVPKSVPTATATTRMTAGGTSPSRVIAPRAAPRPPIRNCPSAPKLNSRACRATPTPRVTKMNGVALSSASVAGRIALAMSRSYAALDGRHDPARVSPTARTASRRSHGSRGRWRRRRRRSDRSRILQVVEVREDDEDRAKQEREYEGEHRHGATPQQRRGLAPCGRAGSTEGGSLAGEEGAEPLIP